MGVGTKFKNYLAGLIVTPAQNLRKYKILVVGADGTPDVKELKKSCKIETVNITVNGAALDPSNKDVDGWIVNNETGSEKTISNILSQYEYDDESRITITAKGSNVRIVSGNNIVLRSTDVLLENNDKIVLEWCNMSEGKRYRELYRVVSKTNLFGTFNGNLDVVGTFKNTGNTDIIGRLLVSNVETDLTAKTLRLGSKHYENAEEPFYIFIGTSNSTTNVAAIGGSTSLGNAATDIKFYTALDTKTQTGTYRGGFKPNGQFELLYIPEYSNNTTAKAAGLTNGMLYRTGETLKIVY